MTEKTQHHIGARERHHDQDGARRKPVECVTEIVELFFQP